MADKNQIPQDNDELEFEIMPDDDGQVQEKKEDPPQKKTSPLMPSTGPGENPKRRMRIWAISGAVIVALAIVVLAGLYFIGSFGNDSGEPSQVTNGLESASTADIEDSDEDGLSDQREFELGTDQQNSDSDDDGLADGDEVNVYGSDPLLVDTDLDTFDDGREVAGGFSPVVNTPEGASDEEQSLWAERIAEFGLHEPTLSTLDPEAGSNEEPEGTAYENTVFGYSVQVPGLLMLRDDAEGQNAGLYVSGTNPEEDLQLDPITISVGSLVEGQTLNNWLDTVYTPDEDYVERSDVNSGVRLNGIVTGGCPTDRTFFLQDSTIIIVQLACNESQEFLDLYSQVVESFKFTQ